MSFFNLLMLAGLVAVAIPPLIHLLSRRRFEVVDWGAMQFLKISETTRRRLLIEELLLMLLRMALIAVLVLALAGPYTQNTVLARLGGRINRDVVLVFDGSYSMGQTTTGKSTHEMAKEWATKFVESLTAGDSVAILQAKQQVVPIVGEPSSDLRRVRDQITQIPGPRGGCDWPQALQAAEKILEKSQRGEREIIVLSDNQRFSWADDTSLLRWELLARQLNKGDDRIKPRVWVVNLAGDRPETPANWTLLPLRASRAIASAGQRVTFRTGLRLLGQDEYRPPHRIRLEVDGQQVSDITAPQSAKLEKGQVPLTFQHRFMKAGSHLVSVVVEPDPPPELRQAGYVVKDHLPGDNRQDFSLEVVPALPVLIVDGEPDPEAKRRGSDFLRDALSPARDTTPVVRTKVVPISGFDPALLNDMGPVAGVIPDGDKQEAVRPRVVVLSNVARLTTPQQEAMTQFLTNGGGVLVTLGERCVPAWYNEQLFRGGQGWLPARLDDVTGDESKLSAAPSPLPSTFFHPALDLFRDVPLGGLGNARVPRYWKVTVPGKNSSAVPVALLNNNDPFLVERTFKGGRVLLCPIPLDASWRTNLPDLLEFAPLAHELVYYLAGARSSESNLIPGQPLRYRADTEGKLDGLVLEPPEGDPKPLKPDAAGNRDVYSGQLTRTPQGPILAFEGTRETGVYQVRTPDDQSVYYVVQPDPRESDLTPNTETDRENVNKLIPMKYEDRLEGMTAALTESSRVQELWWWFLLGLIALLCSEVWMTRRIVRGR